jgi:membrane protease YdiL (CAAX protease family)
MSVTPTSPPTRTSRGPGSWSLAALEVLVAVCVVLLDVLLPALVLLVLWGVSSLVRHEGPSAVGLRRPDRPGRMVAQVLVLSVGWTALVFTVVTPVVEQLAGERRDVSQFAALEGDLPLLVLMVALSWTLAAFCEELAFRGYLLTRSQQLLSPLGGAAPVLAVLLSSLAFGLVHTEQGIVGVVLTTVDALVFAALRFHYATVWASVVAHGTINTIGMTAYFLAGPVPSPW